MNDNYLMNINQDYNLVRKLKSYMVTYTQICAIMKSLSNKSKIGHVELMHTTKQL